jgi:hypothetical protein
MKRPFTLAQVALKAYAVVFVLILLLLFLGLCNPLSSMQSIGMAIYIAPLVCIIVALMFVAKGLSKGKLWAQICAAIIFIGISIIAVPMLILSMDDKYLLESIWPWLWVVILGETNQVSRMIGDVTIINLYAIKDY